MKILVAEDDLVLKLVLKNTLEALGHEVVVADNGRVAWELQQKEPFPLIVADWMMPEMDGLELCGLVRQCSKRYTYFILVTARAEQENYRQAMDAGVDDFLIKPLRKEDLLIRLRVAERILGFMTSIRKLRELLPICAYCKNIRDDRNYWHRVESYLQEATGADFSHGICPECFDRQMKSLNEGRLDG